jgi:uncharacterized membrane protein YvlD (DUF360 family)
MLLVLGLVGLVVAGIILAIVGTLFGIAVGVAGFLLFKVAPVLLIGWVLVKLVQRSRNRQHISAADQRWLDS